MTTALVQVAAAVAAAATGTPTFLDMRNADNGGSEKLRSRKPAVLEILRAASTGSIAVYGADLPNAHQGDTDADGTIDSQVFVGDGTTTVFDSDIPYAAFSNYNFITVSGWNQDRAPAVVPNGGGAGQVAVSDNGGLARFTFGTAPADGKRIAVFKVTPSEIKAAATTQFVKTTIQTRDLVWYVATGGTVSSSDIWIRGVDA